MNYNNPYQAYSELSMMSQTPLNLVVALYEGAIDAAHTAGLCLESGDIRARTRAINKGVSILTELIVSLNQEKGGEIAINLKRLYGYMQRRLLEAHCKKSAAPVQEVEALLRTMLDGWRQAAATGISGVGENSTVPATHASLAGHHTAERHPEADSTKTSYGGYWNEFSDTHAQTAYSF